MDVLFSLGSGADASDRPRFLTTSNATIRPAVVSSIVRKCGDGCHVDSFFLISSSIQKNQLRVLRAALIPRRDNPFVSH